MLYIVLPSLAFAFSFLTVLHNFVFVLIYFSSIYVPIIYLAFYSNFMPSYTWTNIFFLPLVSGSVLQINCKCQDYFLSQEFPKP